MLARSNGIHHDGRVALIAVLTHQMLGDVAAIRMALAAAVESSAEEATRQRLLDIAHTRLDALEQQLKQLMVLPRDELAGTEHA